MFVCLPCLCLLYLHLLACLAGWVLCLLVACWAGQRSSGEDSYLTKLPGLRKTSCRAVRCLGTKHHSWEEQQDEQIILVQGCMAHLSHCARAMWIRSVCFCACVLQPISLMGSGRRCNAIGQSSAIEAATVVSLSEASSMHFEEMAPETLGQAHAEQLHILSLGMNKKGLARCHWLNQASRLKSC